MYFCMSVCSKILYFNYFVLQVGPFMDVDTSLKIGFNKGETISKKKSRWTGVLTLFKMWLLLEKSVFATRMVVTRTRTKKTKKTPMEAASKKCHWYCSVWLPCVLPSETAHDTTLLLLLKACVSIQFWKKKIFIFDLLMIYEHLCASWLSIVDLFRL